MADVLTFGDLMQRANERGNNLKKIVDFDSIFDNSDKYAKIIMQEARNNERFKTPDIGLGLSSIGIGPIDTYEKQSANDRFAANPDFNIARSDSFQDPLAPSQSQEDFLNGVVRHYEDAASTPTNETEPQESSNNGEFVIASIRNELSANDDGSSSYAMSVLRSIPQVFARYENGGNMQYFLAGQPGRQRETEYPLNLSVR